MNCPSPHDRLLEAARQLFVAQGIQGSTTKQIAELAEVNEATLFRQFGSKHGLLLGLLEEADLFDRFREVLGSPGTPSRHVVEAVRCYAIALLDLLDWGSEFLRSLVGESGQFSEQNCRTFGRILTQLNRIATHHLAMALPQDAGLDAAEVQSLARWLNCTVLGYAVMEFTSDAHNLWSNREEFLADLEEFFSKGYATVFQQRDAEAAEKVAPPPVVSDLPANLVQETLQRAKKRGAQDYALAYVAFSTGLSDAEIASLERWHYINDPPQHLLQVTQGAVRQVPLNQWVTGQKYGSNSRNPLTQWLDIRKDDWQAVFFVGEGNPANEADIRRKWQAIVEGLLTPQGIAPTMEHARQTWYVDMLMRGVSVEDLVLLAELDADELRPYVHRAEEKAALERAMRLDAKI